MPLRSLILALALLPILSCAHAPEAKEKRAASSNLAKQALTSEAQSAVSAQTDAAAVDDADGDGVIDSRDGCPLDPGETNGVECPQKWGYFFLRVIDGQQRLPVKATLAFQPSVNKMVAAEDGYSGVLRPGTYLLRVEAPGYKSADVTFEVVAEEKALVEVELEHTLAENR
jgi:hypothetical protein